MSAATATPPTPLQPQTENQTRPHRSRRPRNNKESMNKSGTTTDEDTQQGSSARSHRGHGGGRARPARDALLALRPASVAPPARLQQSGSTLTPSAAPFTPSSFHAPTPATPSVSISDTNRHPRGRGGRHQAGRGQQHSIVESRQFGGALTEARGDGRTGNPANSNLQANALEFQPEQLIPSLSETRPRQRQAQPRKRRPSKSTAPDIATRIHEDSTLR